MDYKHGTGIKIYSFGVKEFNNDIIDTLNAVNIT